MSRAGEHDPAISRWLILCLIIIFAMAMFDSVNRLTPSDASALNQDSAHSFLAPLDAAEWGRAFDRFRQSSEYKKINPGMELADFKAIFWFYYTQRTLGRLIIPFFLISNGLLTGSFLNSPIVWYDGVNNTELRIFTIPIEDFIYGFLLISTNILVYEYLKNKFQKVSTNNLNL